MSGTDLQPTAAQTWPTVVSQQRYTGTEAALDASPCVGKVPVALGTVQVRRDLQFCHCITDGFSLNIMLWAL